MNAEEIAVRLLALKDRADHDPQVQDYLSKVELPQNLEYVKPDQTGRRGGYFRRKPRRDSVRQLKHKLNFSMVACDQFGIKGTTILNDGRIISKAARAIGNELRGTGSIQDPKMEAKERLIKVLKSHKTIIRVWKSWV